MVVVGRVELVYNSHRDAPILKGFNVNNLKGRADSHEDCVDVFL